jgi:hypothetical protein
MNKRRKLILYWAGGSGANYLFLDRFTTDAAAPLTTPRAAEPGPGTLTIVDTNNIMSVSGGQLVINGTGAVSDRIYSTSAHARQTGRAFLISVPTRTTVNANLRFGLSTLSTGVDPDLGVDYNTSAAPRLKISTAVLFSMAPGTGTQDWAIIMRGTGAFLLSRGGGASNYTLQWVHNAGTGALFSKIGINAAVALTAAFDDWRIVDLGGAFATDYGLATDRKATSTAGDTITHEANCIVEHTLTAATGVTQDIMIRRTDDNNCWIIRCAPPGTDTIAVIEKNAGVETSRASTAQTWLNGTAYRVSIVCDGNSITPFVAITAKTGYASASFNNTATSAKVDRAGTDFVSWPRTVALPNV